MSHNESMLANKNQTKPRLKVPLSLFIWAGGGNMRVPRPSLETIENPHIILSAISLKNGSYLQKSLNEKKKEIFKPLFFPLLPYPC